MEELKINPEKKFKDMVEVGRKMAKANGIVPANKVKFVGWQLHYVLEDKEGNTVLQSLGGYAEGFRMEDYES